MIDNYDGMKKVPIVDMTIGDVVDFFEIIYARKHGGDEDVKRSVSEVKARFMAEALYKYYNYKEPNSKTSNAPAREEKVNWDEDKGGIQNYSTAFRAAIVKNLAKKFKKDFYTDKLTNPNPYENYLFKDDEHSDSILMISLDQGNNIYVTFIIGETSYKRIIPLELSIVQETASSFWAKYAPKILSMTDELIEQIEEGH